MYIKTITVRNFQSHKKTVVQLHDGVNAIIGESDQGKSALMRAFIWPITNKPSGSEFCSWWGGNATVEIEMSNGIIIGRERGTSDNSYYIIDGETCDEFKAFGQGVPAEVSEIFNIDTISIQNQHDVPFLLSESSGSDIAKVFNRIANLTDIDTAITSIRKKATAATQKATFVQEQLDNLEIQLEGFKYLPDMALHVGAYEGLRDQEKTVHAAILSLVSLMTLLGNATESIMEEEKLISLEPLIIKVEKRITVVNRIYKKSQLLSDQITEVGRLEKVVKESDALIRCMDSIDKLIELSEGLDDKQTQSDLLQKLVNRVESSTNAIRVHTKSVNVLQREYSDAFPDVCPLCEKEVK